MASLQAQLLRFLEVPAGSTVRMLVRMGIGDEIGHAPRRRPADFSAC